MTTNAMTNSMSNVNKYTELDNSVMLKNLRKNTSQKPYKILTDSFNKNNSPNHQYFSLT